MAVPHSSQGFSVAEIRCCPLGSIKCYALLCGHASCSQGRIPASPAELFLAWVMSQHIIIIIDISENIKAALKMLLCAAWFFGHDKLFA